MATAFKSCVALAALALVAFSPFYAVHAEGETTTDRLKELGKDADSFVEGNLYFIAYHELAHAMVSEFDLPVVGREEDGADRLATLLMTPEDGKEEPEYLLAATRGWFQTADSTALDDISWWDEHGTDQQRGYQIACLLYGANADDFSAVAEAVELPEDRRQSCIGEAQQNQKSWDALLALHQTGENEEGDKSAITVAYEETKNNADDLDYLKKIGLMEDVAEFMTSNYKFKPGIKVTAKECGEQNAYWSASDRELTMCYELVDLYRKLAEQ